MYMQNRLDNICFYVKCRDGLHLGNRGTLRLDDMTGENGSIVRLKTEVDVEELSKREALRPV